MYPFSTCRFLFSATIIVPAALNRVIFDAITPKALRDAFDRDNGNSHDLASNRFDGNSDQAIDKYIVETRLINLAIFIGLFMVLWTPFVLWKRIVSGISSLVPGCFDLNVWNLGRVPCAVAR